MNRVIIDGYLIALDQAPEEAAQTAVDIAQQIETDKLPLVGFVQSLGPYLTEDDVKVRVKAINFLASTLANLPSTKLNSRQLVMLAEFFCERFEDEEALKEAASGVVAILRMKSFSSSTVKTVTEGLAKVDMAKHLQGTRYVVYQICEALLERHRKALLATGDEFVKQFVGLASGEKDPRNLMLAFSLFNIIATEFGTEELAETLFDAVFCYFPITFTPPADDPYKITSEDLKLRLRACVASTPLFAKFSFPCLIEKLTSSSVNVKRDSMLTMTACVEAYGPVCIAEHWLEVWNAVKYEVLHGAEEDITSLTLDLLKQIGATLSFGQLRLIPDSGFDKYLKQIMSECNEKLQNVKNKQAHPAAQILAKVSESCYIAQTTVLEASLPLVIKSINTANSPNMQDEKLALEIIVLFVDAVGVLCGYKTDAPESSSHVVDNTLLPYKDSLLEIMSRALVSTPAEEVSFRLLALQGMFKISNLRGFLLDNEVGMVVQYLDDIVLSEPNDILTTAAVESLKDLGRNKAELILSICFPFLLAELPDVFDPTATYKRHYRFILSTLADLAVDKGIVDVLSIRLLNKLSVVLGSPASDEAYAQSILAAILLVVQRKSKNGDADLPYFLIRLVPKLFSVDMAAITENPTTAIDAKLADVSARIVLAIVRSASVEDQQKFADELFKLYITGEPSGLIDEIHRSKVAGVQAPLADGSSVSAHYSMFTAAVAGLRREVALPVQDLSRLVLSTVARAGTTFEPENRLALLQLIALLMNKWATKEDEQTVMSGIAPLVEALKTSENVSERLNRLEVISWVAKGLILKSNRDGLNLTGQIVPLLADKSVGKAVSKAINILISDDDSLNKDNYAVVRLLAKQQFFMFCIPKFVEGFNAAESAVKPNYLVALSNVLKYMPGKVIVPQLPTFLPLLFQSLTLDDPEVKVAAIDTISTVFIDAADLMVEHLSSLVPELLASSSTAQARRNTVKVRLAAIKCLTMLPKAVRRESFQPYVAEIIKKLGAVLDDPKREVRKAAVDCRQLYFMMDE
ncbi:Dos2-interacting transcription regulator of RNA-Pol-II-domain-containing protein [Dipodascopsis tothii]|uniref:Dos2-interacting transcription regulator of RNA-Pol-II-domain-containing protein n=1 Tax=Dipodascopsis tothii TaxID=44089 RepID=UPI0034D012A9